MNCFALGLSFTALTCSTNLVLAATGSIPMPINAIETYSGASIVHSAVTLPNSGTPAISVEFVLPPGYKPDTPIKLRLHLSANGTACTVRLEPQQSERTRPGKPRFNSAERIVFLNGGTTSIPGGLVVTTKTVEIRKPQTAPFSGLKSGDGFQIRLRRDSSHGADTCTDTVFINHVELRYQRK